MLEQELKESIYFNTSVVETAGTTALSLCHQNSSFLGG